MRGDHRESARHKHKDSLVFLRAMKKLASLPGPSIQLTRLYDSSRMFSRQGGG